MSAASPTAAAPASQGVSLSEVERFADPQSCSPEHDDQRSQASAVRTVACRAHDGDDLLDGRWVGRKAETFVFRGRPWW
jgi:hypothetical protein